MLRSAAFFSAAIASGLPEPFIPDDLTVDMTARRPNFLVFLIDDMGYSDTAVFGSPNHTTPHFDALVNSGMKFTQWISAAPICTPSRAALQTGRYPIRTGCMGNVEKYRVIPTPSSPGGLDPTEHLTLAHALRQAGYATGMSGKWHLGINGNSGKGSEPDSAFTPNANGYETYLGSPYTNAPMCEMDDDGISQKISTGPSFCFMTANTTVVEQPLRLENFTKSITDHAVGFLDEQGNQAIAAKNRGEQPSPWFFFMSYFHVHTPLFTNRLNRGRSRGGEFGDNVEEMDDSIGEIMASLKRNQLDNNTLIFITSDNGPYQEEGWEKTGRTAVYDDAGEFIGRLTGGKGQLYEGGIRMPGAAVWPGVIEAGSISDTFVSTVDIYPTLLAAAGVDVGKSYAVDGKSMLPVLEGQTTLAQHEVFLHYCGFSAFAARVFGRFKLFWATPKWYTNDPEDDSICVQCCNGVNSASVLTGTTATQLCGCTDADMDFHDPPLIFDMKNDIFELHALSADSWPADAEADMATVVSKAEEKKEAMQSEVPSKPDITGAGTCTAGLPAAIRQPCCPGCHAKGFPFPSCKSESNGECSCNNAPSPSPPQHTRAIV
jgi:steryl-sulfatase